MRIASKRKGEAASDLGAFETKSSNEFFVTLVNNFLLDARHTVVCYGDLGVFDLTKVVRQLSKCASSTQPP